MLDTTALATIWNGSKAAPFDPARYELLENFRPVWRSTGTLAASVSTTSTTKRPLASLLALHLNTLGQLSSSTGLALPKAPRQPLMLSHAQAHAIYDACEGLIVTVVRFDSSCIREQESICMQRAGVPVDLLDSAGIVRRA